MNTETRTTLNLSHELAELVDDYWHTQRLSSRNEAIRKLITEGLEMWTGKPIRLAKEKRR